MRHTQYIWRSKHYLSSGFPQTAKPFHELLPGIFSRERISNAFCKTTTSCGTFTSHASTRWRATPTAMTPTIDEKIAYTRKIVSYRKDRSQRQRQRQRQPKFNCALPLEDVYLRLALLIFVKVNS
jgi:hypothetical protein